MHLYVYVHVHVHVCVCNTLAVGLGVYLASDGAPARPDIRQAVGRALGVPGRPGAACGQQLLSNRKVGLCIAATEGIDGAVISQRGTQRAAETPQMHCALLTIFAFE